jgi:hypothetical protein
VADALANDNWIRDIFHNITAPLIWELVDAAAFNGQDENDDEIVWTRSPDGSYSARSAYRIQFDGSSESIFPASVWKQWAPSKCKFFLWLLLVWTADRLMQREWPKSILLHFLPA